MSIPTVCYEFSYGMALLEIRKYPDPVLATVAPPVKSITGDTAKLVGDLLETMYAAPGVGLAAPQVGVSERVIVLDIDHENPRKQVLKLINPVITRTEGEVLWEEGCLSIVDFTAEVKRAAQVEVIAFDENQKEIKIQADGLLAVALQHEIDHLDGKLFIDRISRLKRDLYRRRRKKMLRDGTAPATENSRVLI
jgi:peptide deformylase